MAKNGIKAEVCRLSQKQRISHNVNLRRLKLNQPEFFSIPTLENALPAIQPPLYDLKRKSKHCIISSTEFQTV